MRENALLAFPPEAFEEDVVCRSFFGRRQIILNRPAGIQHILIDNPENYRRTPATMRMLRPLLGNGLLLSQGEDWKYQRRTVAPAFASRTMPLLAGHVARAAQATVTKLAGCSAQPADLLTAMQSLALEIAGTSMFSLAMDRYRPELRDLITRYTAGLGRPSLLDFLLPLAIPSPRDLLRRRVRRQWVALFGRIIAERRVKASQAAPRDLFDLLSTARDPETGAPFSPEGLVDQVATLIAAGHETTGVALFWSLWLVAAAPAVQELLAAEVESLDLGPDTASEILPRLVHTRAVVQETLRLYPPAFIIVRQARADDDAGGVRVPAGGMVFISPWVLHRHRRLWSQPEVFDPARFLPGASPPNRFAYLPFGVGPRVCIGAQFALTEATLVLATMIKAFEIERANGEPLMPIGIVTTQPDHPPLFQLRSRH
ncbi:MAG: cytochrome P450 [Alphaproteobacteria bacterium]|nr:cytochrome P450 [Alphaproteobacteria bacterium]